MIADAADPAVQRTILDMFPQSELPSSIPNRDRTPHIIRYAEIMRALKKMKRGKAPGLTGWTTEHLLPLLLKCPPRHVTQFEAIFTALVNVNVSPLEARLMKTGVIIPFSYRDRPEKIRPIVLICSVVKLCWHIALLDFKDPTIDLSGHTFGKRSSCQLAIAAVKAAIDDGRVVVCCDAQNAFNTLHRDAALRYMQSKPLVYGRIYSLVNLFYAEPSYAILFARSFAVLTVTVTTGTRQGCVSGPMFYTVGTLPTSLLFKGQLV